MIVAPADLSGISDRSRDPSDLHTVGTQASYYIIYLPPADRREECGGEAPSAPVIAKPRWNRGRGDLTSWLPGVQLLERTFAALRMTIWSFL